jgi:hypothetical protein
VGRHPVTSIRRTILDLAGRRHRRTESVSRCGVAKGADYGWPVVVTRRGGVDARPAIATSS